MSRSPAAGPSSAGGDRADGPGDDAERQRETDDRTRVEDATLDGGRDARLTPRAAARFGPRVAARQNTEIVSEPSARDAARCAFSRRFSVAWLGYLAARY